MAVAYNQIEELIHVISDHVSQDTLTAILAGLKATVAYQKNKSFRDTINRLYNRSIDPEPDISAGVGMGKKLYSRKEQ